MCGIAGFWTAQKLEEGDEQKLKRMISAQHHRGPDGEGQFLLRDNGLAFGHARLTIIDLVTGAQPLKTENEELALIVNGEFYDYKRIRSTLMAEGARFQTKSDSEIALHLYQRMGLDFMERLRGEFAFALYDRKRDMLMLVRDRFGIRPLFFHCNGRDIYFASEVKSLLAHPSVPRRLSPQAALNQLMHTMVPGSSAFEGIEAVQPGCMLLVRRKGEHLEVEQKRYWDLDFPLAKERDASIKPETHIERIRDQLVQAVVLRLEADVPVGCYLSGGIDSCCILGIASGAQQSAVKAFTIAFDSDDYDESDIAKEMAARAQADQDIIYLKADELYGENYVRTVYHAERTFYNTLGVAKWCMSRHVHEAGYKTVVTGEGSDELFAGYPAFKRDMIFHGLKDEPEETRQAFQQALEEANKIFKGAILPETKETHPAFEEICGFTPSWIQPWLATLKIARPLLADPVLEEIKDYDPVAAIAEKIDSAKLKGRHPLDRAQYTWSKTMLEGQILNWGGDRVDMANSMESRPAFLDHHLAETAMQVPPSLRIRGNIEKWVLREAVRGVIPETLYQRQKFAFMAPPAHTDKAKQNRVGKLIDGYLNEDAVKRAGLFDATRVKEFLDQYQSDSDPVSLTRKDALLNHLICLQILHHHFIEGDPAKFTYP